jgi:hypothetical protein
MAVSTHWLVTVTTPDGWEQPKAEDIENSLLDGLGFPDSVTVEVVEQPASAGVEVHTRGFFYTEEGGAPKSVDDLRAASKDVP